MRSELSQVGLSPGGLGLQLVMCVPRMAQDSEHASVCVHSPPQLAQSVGVLPTLQVRVRARIPLAQTLHAPQALYVAPMQPASALQL